MIDIYNPKKNSSESLANLQNLSLCLDLPTQEILEAQEILPDKRYKLIETPKSDGSLREVYSPHFLIRKIQRRINSRILSNPRIISWPNHIFGSIPNQDIDDSIIEDRDYISCAKQHCGAKSVLTLGNL